MRLAAHIGPNIRLFRVARGLTQAQLAIRAGLRQPEISDLERGVRPRTRDDLARVAKALGVQTRALLDGPVRIGPAARSDGHGEDRDPGTR